MNPTELNAIIEKIKKKAKASAFRLTLHAQTEMVEREIVLDEILEAIDSGTILENYPEHKRGACCLVYGQTTKQRSLHIVCTTSQERLIIITAYEPKPPKWVSPTERR